MKTEHADDDAIVDDTAGQAYVEQFAQQTFDRGEKVLRADKVTRYAPLPPIPPIPHQDKTPSPSQTMPNIVVPKTNRRHIRRRGSLLPTHIRLGAPRRRDAKEDQVRKVERRPHPPRYKRGPGPQRVEPQAGRGGPRRRRRRGRPGRGGGAAVGRGAAQGGGQPQPAAPA